MGNLFTRRAIAFLVAIVLAIIAVVAVLNYVRGVEQEASQRSDLVVAYVATQRIETGTLADTAIEAEVIEERSVPRELVAPDAVTDLSQIRGRTVQEIILPGDQIVSSRFSTPGESADVLVIPDGEQAVSFQVAVAPGVAGFVRPGDTVSIISVTDAAGTVDDDGETVTDGQARSQYVLQNVEVLALGRRVGATEESPSGATVQDEGGVLLTVAVTPEEAERLVYGTTSTTLWLTLLPEDDADPVSTPGVTPDTYFDN